MVDFYETVGGNLDALLMQFAVDLVGLGDTPLLMSQQAIWKAFTTVSGHDPSDRTPAVPDWAKRIGEQVDVVYLRGKTSERKLTKELQRLRLLPESKHHSYGWDYALEPAAIRATVEAVLGKEAVKDASGEGPDLGTEADWEQERAIKAAQQAACRHGLYRTGGTSLDGETVMEKWACRKKCGHQESRARGAPEPTRNEPAWMTE
jgi:hypothetical protein